MRVRLIIVNLLMIKVNANVDREFIVDYFIYKKAPRVVGLTCNNDEDNIVLIKKFGEVGITSFFGKLYDQSLLYRLLNTNHYKLGILVDFNCDDYLNASAILSLATHERLYDELHHWLVILPSYSDNTTDFVSDDTFNFSTDFVVAAPSFSYDNYELYDMYNPFKRRGGHLNVTSMGAWSQTNGLSVTLTQDKYNRRSNLHGLYWKVFFFNSKYRPKNVSLEDHFQDFEKTGTKDGLSKFGYNIISPLAEMHNATMLIGEYIKWKKEDKLGPLTKALMYEEIDLSGTPISVFVDKLNYVKFVYTAWPFRTGFIFRSPPSTDIKVHEVLNPLENNVWYLTSLMLVLFVLMLTLNFHFEHINSNFMQLSNAFLITIGCLCQQGTNEQLNQISTRIVFLFMMIFSLLIYNYYSASIVSVRLNEPVAKINDSLDYLALTNLDVASEPMIYFDFFMQQNPKETDLFNIKKWMNIPEVSKFITPEKGISRVKGGGFAYHAHPEVSYPYINRLFDNREICELMEIHLAKPSFRSIAVGYNSSFTEISRRGFTKINEVGIRKRQYLRWTSKKPHCRKDILTVSSTNLYEFAPHLILLGIGMALAIVLWLIEIIVGTYYYRKNRFKKKIDYDVEIAAYFKKYFH